MCKAFDRVLHEGLIFKFNCIGIKGHLFDRFKSSLTRKIEKSAYLFKTRGHPHVGVPQASVLDPMLV